ncbi:hypothetical protein N7495_007621 [Penicillium taxi]|uniref:uncharacterized protein n=1 Tax=Penicillium taxi TaxID=168475 RepID=UPI0025458007|nr:uncharacterized protein N7495_007621 [Penicillium taxi]KAJ5887580.1 hypothetical protein N7495_007621 [Penicillium taxi]
MSPMGCEQSRQSDDGLSLDCGVFPPTSDAYSLTWRQWVQYIEHFHSPHGIRQCTINYALAADSVTGSIISGPISNRIGRRLSILCLFLVADSNSQAGA